MGGDSTEENNKATGKHNKARAGLDSLYKRKCRGIDAGILVITTLILQSKTIASLITAIADYA